MSNIIYITIVMENGKQCAETEIKNKESVILTHDSSMTIMSTLLKNGLIEGSFCGGRGDCARCKIQFLSGAVMPTALERSVMEPEELRQGYRLACLAKPKDNCVIKLALTDTPQVAIVTDMIPMAVKNDYISQNTRKTIKQKPNVIEPEDNSQHMTVPKHLQTDSVTGVFCEGRQKKCGETMIAVDLGTTTIAMQLVDLDSGRIMDTYCEMNPQRRYGADVLSRIKAACEGSRRNLQNCVQEVLERGVSRFQKSSAESGSAIVGMCIAGNTTMGHLLMGHDVSTLGRSPFTPVEIGLQEYRHNGWNFTVWVAPGISAFVGGDVVAGLYALDMLTPFFDKGGKKGVSAMVGDEAASAAEAQDNRAELLIDLGTNGEMAMTDGRRMIVTATAAGPAFEGGAGAEVVGSDMVACTAQLLHESVLDETGLLAEPYFTEGVSVGKPAVRLCGRDIRDLQMAKGAVRAGIEILWRQMGRPEIGRVCLAGGFGYYLDVEAAFCIGLLPEYLRGRVQAVGNTALAGAFRMGRDLYRGIIDRQKLAYCLSSIESINLAEQDGFEKLYIENMELRQG